MYTRLFGLLGVTVAAYATIVSESETPPVKEKSHVNTTAKELLSMPTDVKLRSSELEQEVEALQKEVLALTEFVRSQTSGKMRLRSGNEGSTAQSNGVAHSQYRIKRAQRRRRHAPGVVFNAVLMHEKLTTGSVTPIKFNHVITNENEAYNAETGIFTAPRQGTYFFSTTVMADKGQYVEASIHVNDRPLVTAVSDDGTQGSIGAILNLNTGDKVHVAIIWPSGPHSLLGVGKSSFIGFLITNSGINRANGLRPVSFQKPNHFRNFLNNLAF